MKKIRKKYFIVYLAIMIVGLIVCLIYYYNKDVATLENIMSYVDGDAIIYSEKSGVFDDSLAITLELNDNFPDAAEIYYSVNGSNPTIHGRRYERAIELKITDELKSYEVKAVVYYKGEYSNVFKEEYILYKNTGSKYGLDTVYITTSLSNLYDYETGIFAEGKTRELYEKNGDANVEGYVYGNYNMRGDEWIRDAHLFMFGAEGELIINDAVGIGVSGGSSSMFDAKSLKIYSDEKYGSENDKFYLDLREDDISYYSNVTEYNSLRLRSGSQDMSTGNIRSAVMSKLALDSNFDGCTESRRCIVYLNGTFYGIFDIQQNFSNSFLARRFNLSNTEQIEKVKMGECYAFEQVELQEIFGMDLNNEENRKKLEAQVDMDNYILYYAIEILCGNTDWPNNGFEIWRYTGEKEEENKYTDGRWRFLLFDVDLSFPIEGSDRFMDGKEQFDMIMQGINLAEGTTFINVMRSEYYRNKFVTIVCDLLNTPFSTENMLETINTENDRINLARNEFYDTDHISQSEYFVEQMRQYALTRSEKIREYIARYFGLVDKYMLNLEIPEGVEVYWNNEKFYAGEKYSCEYYKGVQLVLNQNAYPGYRFQYWLVNNQPIYGDSLIISDDMVNNGVIDIKLVLEREDKARLVISEIHSRGVEDWIELTNVGSKEENISQYYLTDESDNLQKYQLPQMVLGEGESIVIHGSKNKEALGDYICNFSLREHETLILSDGNNISDQVYVPRMAKQETYMRYDNSNQWMFRKAEE